MAGSILYTITQPISVFGDNPMNSAERDLFMQKLRKLALQCRESPDASLVFSAVKPTYVTIVEFPLHTTFPSYYHLAETEYKGNRILLYLESFMKRLDTPAEKKTTT